MTSPNISPAQRCAEKLFPPRWMKDHDLFPPAVPYDANRPNRESATALIQSAIDEALKEKQGEVGALKHESEHHRIVKEGALANVTSLRAQLATVTAERDEAIAGREKYRAFSESFSMALDRENAELDGVKGEIDQLVMERDAFHDERDAHRAQQGGKEGK